MKKYPPPPQIKKWGWGGSLYRAFKENQNIMWLKKNILRHKKTS